MLFSTASVRQAGIIQAVEDLTPSTTDKENWITL